MVVGYCCEVFVCGVLWLVVGFVLWLAGCWLLVHWWFSVCFVGSVGLFRLWWLFVYCYFMVLLVGGFGLVWCVACLWIVIAVLLGFFLRCG